MEINIQTRHTEAAKKNLSDNAKVKKKLFFTQAPLLLFGQLMIGLFHIYNIHGCGAIVKRYAGRAFRLRGFVFCAIILFDAQI